MTIINHKEKHLQIIIETTAPDEQRNFILKAIAASMRWNGSIEHSNKSKDDGESLVAISELFNAMIPTQIIE